MTTVNTLPSENGDLTARIQQMLDRVRAEYGIPAVGGAIVTGKALTALAVSGVRQAGGNDPVLPDDPWHLGSCTKAMTATLAATYVEEGKLEWDNSIASVFPALEKDMVAERQSTTLSQLLQHRAGLPENLDWGIFDSKDLKALRAQVVLMALRTPHRNWLGKPKPLPAGFSYSNTGYTVAGAMIEQTGGKPWEDLMRERLFAPLGMRNCGFGAIETGPQPHHPNGKPPGPLEIKDNMPVIGPAGTVHMPLAAWAAFVADQIRGARGESPTLLKPESYKFLQTPPEHEEYACGWDTADRDWGGGIVLTHGGSNTLNFAVVWVAPAKNFAVLAVANQGGDKATEACDEIASELIELHQAANP